MKKKILQTLVPQLNVIRSQFCQYLDICFPHIRYHLIKFKYHSIAFTNLVTRYWYTYSSSVHIVIHESCKLSCIYSHHLVLDKENIDYLQAKCQNWRRVFGFQKICGCSLVIADGILSLTQTRLCHRQVGKDFGDKQIRCPATTIDYNFQMLVFHL